MVDLDDWLGQACAALGLDRGAVNDALVLDLARDVARAVARPAAPLTAYLLGVATGRGADPVRAAATLTDLASAHAEPTDPA